MRRVVITGIGSVNPLAISWEKTLPLLLSGTSGIGPITRFDTTKTWTDRNGRETSFETTIAGEVRGFDVTNFGVEPRAAKRMDLFSQYAAAACMMAIQDAGLTADMLSEDTTGTIIGTGVGGIKTTCEQLETLEERGPSRVSPIAVAMLMPNANAGNASILGGMKGITFGVVSACAASNDAMGMAIAAIRLGWAKRVVTGGSEAAITPLSIAGFNTAGALATKFNNDPTRASRPFDAGREGFIMSDGSTILIFEDLETALERPNVRIYAEVVGYGSRADAHHITAPPDDADGAVRAMRAALRDAGLSPEEIEYINAHGTSTPINDRGETLAIKTVFGEYAYKVPVSSTKSMVGHSVGYCGAFEAAVCAETLRTGMIAPTINYETPDPECDLDYVPNTYRRQEVRTALSNNFGFGGHNSTIILRKWEGK